MSGIKRFYEGAAELGMCPIEQETWDYLDKLEQSDPSIDWIAYCEYDYEGKDGILHVCDCICVESARRLIELDIETVEIANFVEYFCGGIDCHLTPNE